MIVVPWQMKLVKIVDGFIKDDPSLNCPYPAEMAVGIGYDRLASYRSQIAKVTISDAKVSELEKSIDVDNLLKMLPL